MMHFRVGNKYTYNKRQMRAENLICFLLKRKISFENGKTSAAGIFIDHFSNFNPLIRFKASVEHFFPDKPYAIQYSLENFKKYGKECD